MITSDNSAVPERPSPGVIWPRAAGVSRVAGKGLNARVKTGRVAREAARIRFGSVRFGSVSVRYRFGIGSRRAPSLGVSGIDNVWVTSSRRQSRSRGVLRYGVGRHLPRERRDEKKWTTSDVSGFVRRASHLSGARCEDRRRGREGRGQGRTGRVGSGSGCQTRGDPSVGPGSAGSLEARGGGLGVRLDFAVSRVRRLITTGEASTELCLSCGWSITAESGPARSGGRGRGRIREGRGARRRRR